MDTSRKSLRLTRRGRDIKMNWGIFSTVFILQVMFWIFMNTTRIGRIISGIWISITLLGFLTTFVYPSYSEAWRIGASGDLGVISHYLENFLTNWAYFLIQLVLPPWAGLIIGSGLGSNNQGGSGRVL